MKLNRINKKITSLLFAALMITSVFAAFVTPVMATPGTAFNQFPAEEGARRSALLGQDIRITGLVAGSPVEFRGMVGAADGHFFTVTATAGVADIDTIARGVRIGRYNVTGNITGVGVRSFDLFVDSPTLTLRVELAGTATAVTRVAKGTPVEIDIATNIPGADRGDIRLTGPDGIEWRANPAPAPHNVPLRSLRFDAIDGPFVLNTTGWDAGTWEIQVRTVEENAQGLDIRSTVARLEIIEDEIRIRVTDDTIDVNERTTFTVTAPARRWVNIRVNDPRVVLIPFAGDVTERRTVPGRLVFTDNNSFDVFTRDGGTFVFALEFTDDGRFRVTATLVDREDNIDITVARQRITINSLPAITVGERIDITGTAIGVNPVFVRIEEPGGRDRAIPTWEARRVPVRADDTWRVEWPTAGLDADTYRIEVFKDETVARRQGPGDTPEATIAVRLTHGVLTVVVPSTVSETDSDDLEIRGTAVGTENVLIYVVENHDSTVILQRRVVPVDRRDRTFDEKIGRILDRGTHTVFVIHPGGDGRSDTLPTFALDARGRSIHSIARITERIRDELGRDDTLIMREFTVERDRVAILPIADVVVGEALTIRAETNRDEDTMTIVTLIGPDGRTVEIRTERVRNREVSARFDTRNFTLGTWRVEVEVTGTPAEDATFRIVRDVALPLTGIRVGDATRVEIGRTHDFDATPTPAGAPLVQANVRWTVVNATVGTIDAATGVFTARAAGTTTITATYRGFSTNATATVPAPAVVPTLTGIRVDGATVAIGGTRDFDAAPVPAGVPLVQANVRWTVANATVGTIDATTGVFTARAAGTTTITATYRGFSTNAIATVPAPAVAPPPRTPGFGIIAAILGLLGVALIMLKKNKK